MGCCAGRANDDGKLDYSVANKDKIFADIKDKKDLAPHFTEGWRLHHSVEVEGKKKTFLTYAREVENLDVFKGAHFTVSEEALVEKANDHPNYEFVFSNVEYLNVLVKNYEANGITLTNEDAVNFFLLQEKVHSEDAEKAKTFNLIRNSLGVSKSPLAKEEKKDETPKPIEAEKAKEAEPVHHDAPKEGEAHKEGEVHHDAPQEGEAPKEGEPQAA